MKNWMGVNRLEKKIANKYIKRNSSINMKMYLMQFQQVSIQVFIQEQWVDQRNIIQYVDKAYAGKEAKRKASFVRR